MLYRKWIDAETWEPIREREAEQDIACHQVGRYQLSWQDALALLKRGEPMQLTPGAWYVWRE